MKLIAIETSSRRGSVALLHGTELLEREIDSPRDQARCVLAHVDALLAEAGLALSALDAVAFGRGPGSFTGIRLAVSVSQGLAMAHGLGLVGVSSLAAMAQAAWRGEGVARTLAAVDARMGEVYWGAYELAAGDDRAGADRAAVDPERGKAAGVGPDAVVRPIAEERIGAPESVELAAPDETWAAVGDGFARYPVLAALAGRAAVVLADLVPAARDLVGAARIEIAGGRLLDPEAAEPAYLRGKSAWRREFTGNALTKLQ